MTQRTLRSAGQLALAAALTATLSACGGSSSSPEQPAAVTPPPPPVATTPDRLVTVTGAIQGFGSVIVAGQRYETEGADVVVDGVLVALSDLEVGQIVSLRARKQDGGDPVALKVVYEESLEGPVAAISADRSELSILGQTVLLTEDTVFDDLDPDTIAVDDVLEISGLRDADGVLVASYVELSDDPDEFEVHGVVENLDTDAQTFRLFGLTVFYGDAELEDFEDGEVLSNGDPVEVEGSAFFADGTFQARRVEFEGDGEFDDDDDRDEDEDEEIELEGFVTALTGPNSFEVGSIPVLTDASTEFEGCTADTLALNTEVEVEGVRLEDGTILAFEVECERDSDIRFRAGVDGVEAQTDRVGTIDLLGVLVDTTERTKFRDLGPNRVREFGLDDILPGDVVEVRAFKTADGTRIASMVQRGDRGKFTRDEVRGGFEGENADGTFAVAGVVVEVSDATRFSDDDYDDDDDERTTPDRFFADLDIGDRIKVTGDEVEDDILLADKVNAEDDDDDDEEREDDD